MAQSTTRVSVTISDEAKRRISRKAGRHVIIYCNVFGPPRKGVGPAFIPKITVTYSREPGGQLVVENHGGIPVRIDRWLLSQVSPDVSLSIGLNKGLIKTPKVELVSPRVESA